MSIINNFEQNQEYTPLDSALSRYLCLIDSSTTSTDVLDAALGKNNEEDTYKVGLALAQYSKYLDASVDIKNDFPILTQCDNILDIIEKQARAEITKNINIYEKLKSSPYAVEKLKNYIPFPDDNGEYVVNGVASDTTTVIALGKSTSTYTFPTPLSVPVDGYYTLKTGNTAWTEYISSSSLAEVILNLYCLLANGEKMLAGAWSLVSTAYETPEVIKSSTEIYMTQQNPITGVQIEVVYSATGNVISRGWGCDINYVFFTTKKDVLKKGFSFLEGNNISFVVTRSFVLPADGAITIGIGGVSSTSSSSLKINDTVLATLPAGGTSVSSIYKEFSTIGKKGDIVTYSTNQSSPYMLIRSAEFPVTF